MRGTEGFASRLSTESANKMESLLFQGAKKALVTEADAAEHEKTRTEPMGTRI